MNPSKVISLLEQKKKKKTSVVVNKPIPSTSSIRKTTFVSKNELEKAEKSEKVDKVQKPTVKPKVEIPPKTSKLDKTIKTASINQLPNKPQMHGFDNMRPLTAMSNVALKQTKDNERILGEIEMRFIADEDFDGSRNRKRWSDLPTYPKKAIEGANPNSEDNNLVNQANKLDRQRPHHVRNGSNLSKSQNKDPHPNTGIYENKLQDVTSLKVPKPKPLTRYDTVALPNGYIRPNYGGLEESSALLPNTSKVKPLPKKSNGITEQNKPKVIFEMKPVTLILLGESSRKRET